MNVNFRQIFLGFRHLRWWNYAAFAVVIIIGIGFVSTFGDSNQDNPSATPRVVEVKSVAELSSEEEPLSVVGSVESKSEATVRAEKSGQIVGIRTALGNKIAAGQIAAEIEHGSESAALLQAQGVLDAAGANLAKVTGGARPEQRDILRATVKSSEASLTSAKEVAVNTLLSAYASADNTITGITDPMFTNPNSDSPHFLILTTKPQITIDIQNKRVELRPILVRETDLTGQVNAAGDLQAELSQTENEMRSIRGFLDDIIADLNAAVINQSISASTIATYLASATGARTSITASLSAIAGAKQSLEAAGAGVEIAKKNLEQGVTGGQSEDVAAAKASVKQARGAVAAAAANVEKSIIRAPISGTVNSFSLKRGDYVQVTTPVLTIGNNAALEVVAYLTENDVHEISVGTKASIEGGAIGVVTRIAPALDPITKKIEIRIGITEGADSLINGQSVLVSLDRGTKIKGQAARITIPISAVKVGSDKNVVFTLDEKNALVAHEVQLGALLGDRVVISSGLTPEMKIVTDARGLREGEVVEISSATTSPQSK